MFFIGGPELMHKPLPLNRFFIRADFKFVHLTLLNLTPLDYTVLNKASYPNGSTKLHLTPLDFAKLRCARLRNISKCSLLRCTVLYFTGRCRTVSISNSLLHCTSLDYATLRLVSKSSALTSCN